ncbi:hypothetical protein, partial [Brucella abortus]
RKAEFSAPRTACLLTLHRIDSRKRQAQRLKEHHTGLSEFRSLRISLITPSNRVTATLPHLANTACGELLSRQHCKAGTRASLARAFLAAGLILHNKHHQKKNEAALTAAPSQRKS